MGTPYYMYTPLEHTITNVLWGVFVCTLIALIVVWVSKSRRIKQLEADIQRLQDGLMGKSGVDECMLDEQSESAQHEKARHNSLFVGAAAGLVLIVLGILISLVFPKESSEQESSNIRVSESPQKYTNTPRPTSTATPLPQYNFPHNGTIDYFTFEDDCVAPLEIITSSDYNYTIISVVRVGGVLPIIKAYIHGGETIEFDVPVGRYEIYFAEGDIYYGPQKMFSKEGAYSKFEEPLEFYGDGEYYYGHSLTLYSVYNGNIDTNSIDIEDFPV